MAEKRTENQKVKSNGSFLKNVRTYFREYCNSTSVHGFRYFGEKERSNVERIWWVIVFSICLVACMFSIHEVYKKWERSPVIVNFANRGTPIDKVPFPAVTICPESKIVGQKKFNFTRLLLKKQQNLLTPEEKTTFQYMSLICDFNPDLHYKGNTTFSDEFLDVMDSIRPEINLTNCSFSTFTTFSCDDLFTPLIIDEGVCYSFNILDRSELFRENVLHYKKFHRTEMKTDWSLENGYSENAGVFPYPRRSLSASVTKGLMFNIFSPNTDLDYACKGPVQGYRMLLHAPTDIPRLSQEYFRVPLDQSVVGAIQPVMITTSPSIKKYSPKKRGCYFQEERYLRYFKIYTSANCKLECLTNLTLDNCGCVNFYMPRENGTKICGAENITCMETVDNIFVFVATSQCKCLPRCSDLSYEVVTSQSGLEWNNWLSTHANMSSNDSRVTTVTLFFKSDDFITSERNEFYGPTDFLANFGGLLGLFTGFSVLSLMEILYFLSIRILYNRRLYGRWAGEQNNT